MSVFAVGPTPNANSALQRALRELSTAVPASACIAPRAKQLASRSEEARSQQLRGIFAAFDEDRDGLLSETELISALLSLGFDPTPEALQRFARASPGGTRAIDFPSFLKVCVSRDGETAPLPTTLDAITSLLAELDSGKTGRLPLATLLHALAEVHTPTRLSLEEVQELLRLTGVLTPATVAEPRVLYAMEVDYRAFVSHLAFIQPPPPRPAKAAVSATGAAAPGAVKL